MLMANVRKACKLYLYIVLRNHFLSEKKQGNLIIKTCAGVPHNYSFKKFQRYVLLRKLVK
jgi:hypothetical protein